MSGGLSGAVSGLFGGGQKAPKVKAPDPNVASAAQNKAANDQAEADAKKTGTAQLNALDPSLDITDDVTNPLAKKVNTLS